MELNTSTPTAKFHCNHSSQTLVTSVLPPVMIIEVAVGLPCNLVALWIFWFRMMGWRANVIFLFNLVLADFLLLVSMPFRINYLLYNEDWGFGGAGCRANLFMLAVNRSASIGFMTAVAADRYFKVVHPHHRINRASPRQAWVVVALTWMLVVALRLPLLATKLEKVGNGGRMLCRSFDSYAKPPPSIVLHNAVFTLEFLLPLLLLIVFSARITCILHQRNMDRERKVRRAIRTVVVIVVVFVVCFGPGVFTGLLAVLYSKVWPEDCHSYQLVTQLFSLSIGFTYLNSTLDPVIYCFSSSMFRNALKGSINRLGFVNLQLSRRGSMTSDS
ncbi:hydroxycarboxylic acid receptor 2-like [Alosa alosa]|uniref:hydroxycarboxylic acid receptor 2-like n=1 Tax=Alosa alosa TaxID=278164 RepID=UPI0020150F3B|nr:hydroxycarboxylic acid receptor 2-like [Alosa alosa]XP_048125880.1 hydroxycarboxylic acid receptor 2-like [Alosa alosa]